MAHHDSDLCWREDSLNVSETPEATQRAPAMLWINARGDMKHYKFWYIHPQKTLFLVLQPREPREAPKGLLYGGMAA